MGRETDIEELVSQLRTHRLVTVCGTGGIGKTRLALQVAHRTNSADVASVWVALSSTMAASEVTDCVFRAVSGNESRTAQLDSLTAIIGDQELVLVLDNCEQVVEAAANLVVRLLEQCRGLRVLATSREPLGVPGEAVYPVQPLLVHRPYSASADASSDAVRLFFDRARARDPRLRVTAQAEALAEQICAACDGVPLAIELAAACTGSMTLAEVASRLEDALGLLLSGARAAPDRQHSMRASIDWSHRLLATREQLVLRRLSVFDPDFTLADAEWVCAFDGLQAIEVGYLLDRLVAQSLVHASREGSITCFWLSRAVRQYSQQQLIEADELVRAQTRLTEWSNGGSGSRITGAQARSSVDRAQPARSLAGTAKSSSRRADLLSEREQRVAQLIAGGRSNREIAEELVITKKTAEAHVSHILTKLGLCSRVQIATWSLQVGLAQADPAAARTS